MASFSTSGAALSMPSNVASARARPGRPGPVAHRRSPDTLAERAAVATSPRAAEPEHASRHLVVYVDIADTSAPCWD